MRNNSFVTETRFYSAIAIFCVGFVVLALVVDMNLMLSVLLSAVLGVATFFVIPEDAKKAERQAKLKSFISESVDKVSQLKNLSVRVPDPQSQRYVNDVIGMTTKVIDFLRTERDINPDIIKFVTLYLDKYLQIVSSYNKLAGDSYADDKTKELIVKLAGLIRETREILSQQYNKILRNELSELQNTTLELEALIEIERGVLD